MSRRWHRPDERPVTNSGGPVSGRFAALDRRPVNRDGLAREDPELGLVAMRSPADPEPALELGPDGRVAAMDGRQRERFDVIDRMIADHGLDLEVAPEAMALEDGELARRIVDPGVPRAEVTRLVAGITPAKLAAVVRLLRPVEIQMAIAKMRVRRTPSIQAHVTNRLDDPLLIAADAATAVAFGFRELETTVPVLEDAPSNAVALLIGSQVAAPGALTQCSVEEAMELELGMRGLTTYAETVSLYGTEQVFVDGDDTPWSKAFLCSAYASRGLKMRVTSGGGAEVLMGAAEGCSMLYLESRCVSLARAIGAQGVQNGGIDGASVVGAVPDGMRELLAENLMVMLRDLESCSGNDTLVSESDIRRTAHTVPLLLAGSDFLFSGFGSITRYDNMFGPSNFNGDDLDDYLVLQRDWGVDGGLRPAAEEEVLAVRERAARAAQAVYRRLALADYDEAHVEAVVTAHGSKEVPVEDPLAVLEAATAVQRRPITALEIVAALAEEGFAEEAERVLAMIRERLKGDYLQTAAIFDEDMRVLSKVTDPNDYAGPGTGYEPDPGRRREIASVRQAISVREVRAEQELAAATLHLVEGPPAAAGSNPREVCIGLSPAAGRGIWTTLSGLSVRDALREIEAGLEEEGCEARLIRVRSTVDLGLVGLTAARLAGSGIAVGLQGKGTALIHRRDLVPLANLELYSVAPLIDREMYRTLGINAGRHAKGVVTVPAKNPYTEEAITARYHTRALALVAIERERSEPSPPNELTRAAS
ncbi:MAG: propanediol/glycerol family dehydratase large subunit [Actinobacteria bacterium]|nr:propanediol/glycerol family dehydratase large subunit [Actinomycetota bacterium]